MKTMRLVPIAFAVLGLCHAAAGTPAPHPALPPLPADCHLVWSDEFNYTGAPDPAKWVFERGFVRNNEPQYYTDRPGNVRVEHGHLILEVRKENFTPPDEMSVAYGQSNTDHRWSHPRDLKAPQYTSGSITTVGKASWLYGRFEIRAKMPTGLGPWPALWTLGIHSDWPHCGEIDLLEMQGKPFDMVWGNFHYAIDGKHVSSDRGGILVADSTTKFHTYILDWNPDRIDCYADGKWYAGLDIKKANEAGENPYHKPQYLLLDLALYGGPIDDTIFPQQMVVDYVRVYQKRAP